jgi:glycosyltransferase involved in cell wall biosynthesis
MTPAVSTSARPTLVCLTPVRNEAWIIAQFLAAASVWADIIVLIDQNSTDGTCEIARQFPKVRIAINPMREYDEGNYRKIMFEEARKIPGPRLLFALDADEFLNADLFDTPDWQAMLSLPPGGVAFGHWVNLRDSFRTCHVVDEPVSLCYMDDGRELERIYIHSPRFPRHPTIPVLMVARGRLLHYQYAHWARMKSKQRWYQALETLKYPEKSPLRLYRNYHHMDISWARRDAVEDRWFAGYEQRGIAIRTVQCDPHSWFELELLKLFEQHGAARFRKLAVWDADWPALARHHGFDRPERFADPRSKWERAVHRWLRQTQDHQARISVRLISKFLGLLGW